MGKTLNRIVIYGTLGLATAVSGVFIYNKYNEYNMKKELEETEEDGFRYKSYHTHFFGRNPKKEYLRKMKIRGTDGKIYEPFKDLKDEAFPQ